MTHSLLDALFPQSESEQAAVSLSHSARLVRLATRTDEPERARIRLIKKRSTQKRYAKRQRERPDAEQAVIRDKRNAEQRKRRAAQRDSERRA